MNAAGSGDRRGAGAHLRCSEVAVMEVRRPTAARLAAEPDVMQYCPSCGERGEWQKRRGRGDPHCCDMLESAGA